MSDQEKYVTGEEKDAALSTLGAELMQSYAERAPLPKLEEIRETFTDDQERLAAVLFDPIYLDSFAHERNPLAPTPGDPSRVFHSLIQSKETGGHLSYDEAVRPYLEERLVYPEDILKELPVLPELLDATTTPSFDIEELPAGIYVDRTQHPSLSEDQYIRQLEDRAVLEACLGEVEREVFSGHKYHRSQNTRSMNRLREEFLRNPNAFSADEIEIIERVATGKATDIDRIILLTRHPSMESIESVEVTAPLDGKKSRRLLTEYGRQIKGIEMSGAIQSVTVFDAENQPVTTRHGGHAMTVSKTVLAEVVHNDVTLELVLKRRLERFPTRAQLRGVHSNVVMQHDGTKVNMQPIAFSAYWRVKAKEIPKLYVPPGVSRIAVQAALGMKYEPTGISADELTVEYPRSDA